MKLSWLSVVLTLILVAGNTLASDAVPTDEIKSEIPELVQAKQLILVTTSEWESVSAHLYCFERDEITAPWNAAIPECDAVVGRNGLAWGIGLHGTNSGAGPIKREGDGCAPAGVFELRKAFGYAPSAEAKVTRLPYIELTPTMLGIDDPASRHYNRFVDTAIVQDTDWKSAETMRRNDELYRWGLIIEHNSKPYSGFGSCIFLHIWEGKGHGTSGCTAIAGDRIERLIRWLDRNSSPVLVQLPNSEYARLKAQWNLP